METLTVADKTSSLRGAAMDVLNPATGEVIDQIPEATREDVDRCLDSARKGFQEWSSTPAHQRVAILNRFADLMVEQRDALARLLCRENGKPLEQAEWEIDGGIRLFRSYSQEALRLYGVSIPGDVQPGLERDLLLTRYEPYGVMGAILPFNFPIDIFCHKVAPALATGNAVVLKPAEEAPLTVLRVVELLHKAGVPAEAMQVINGQGPTVGRWLVTSDKLQIVSFTGSTEVGVEIAQSSAKHLTRVFLELGGNDPMVVFADADLNKVVEEAVFGRLLANGQCCCANKRIIAHRSVVRDLTDALVERLQTIQVGDPLDPTVELGPLITEDAAQRAAQQVQLSCEQGAVLRFGHTTPEEAFLGPILLTDVPPSADVARDMEVFAPVWPIISFDDDQEAIQIANNSRYGLSASVFTRDMSKAITAAYGIQSGIVAINGTGLYRPDAAPFGGYKMSGMGREGTTISLEEFSQVKTIALRNVLPGPGVPEPPPVSGA